MARTPLFRDVMHTLRLASWLEQKRLTTAEGLERIALSRRRFLGAAAAASAVVACGEGSDELGTTRLAAKKKGAAIDVGIVGAGFAGLCCADELRRWGIAATLHEASDRVGGRCWSLPGVFPGQVAERGGELIDNLHKTLLGYANEFGLVKEDYNKQPGEIFYRFGGQAHPESTVVDEYRAFVAAMRKDLNVLGAPNADGWTEADRALDLTTLRQYLETRGAGPVIRGALDVAYTIEYGLDTDQQSALNLLLFIHADKRSRFQPFGVFSDERYHIVGGNQAIAEGIRQRLTGPLHLGRRLVRVRRQADGRVELTFKQGNTTLTAVHDEVVLTLPFSVLRTVDLDASLGLPTWKRAAIEQLRYGTNAKLLIGFNGRPWRTLGSNGTAYSDLPNLQNTWETNPTGATTTRAVLTDYTGGAHGASLNPAKAQNAAEDFVADLNQIYPGAAAQATRDAKGKLLVHLEQWSTNPNSLGSYTCNHPGYFTTIADNEGKPVGNLHFAGEHTSSFYEWQGFMEGAALSGIRAAGEVLGAI